MYISTKKIIISILANFVLYFNAIAISDALKVKIFNGSISDETVIRFLPTATYGFDGSYDAYKIMSTSPTVPAIFTKLDPSSNLSINALPSVSAQSSTELYTHIKVAGTYTIQAIELGTGFPSNFKLVLEDKETGNFYNFRNGTSISLPMLVNTLATSNRFCLHVSPPTAVNLTDVTCNGLNNGSIAVSKPGNHSWNYQLANSSSVITSSGNNIDESFTITNLNPGTYTLFTTSNYSLSDTNSITIAEPDPVIADFSSNYEQAYLFQAEIIFTNNSINANLYSWDFGDGTIYSDSANAIHQYVSAGIYTVTLTAINAEGCSAAFTKTIIIEADLLPVNINLTNVTCNGMNNGIIQLTKPENHSWNYQLLDSNSVVVSAGTNIDESYSISNLNPGTYTLYTTSSISPSDTNFISISEPAPVVAAFSSNYDQVYLSAAEIIFTNNSANASIYNWDFGDGTISSDSVSTTHQYLSTGNFLVTLIATNIEGCSSSYTKTITVDADLSTGISDLENSDNLIAFQNEGTLQLNYHSAQMSEIEINIYNNLGQIVYTYNKRSSGLSEAVQLENNGIYIINAIIDNKIQSQKIFFTKQ